MFLYLVPFFNILNYRIGENFSLLIIVLFLMIYIMIAKNRRILSKDEMALLKFSVACLLVVLIDFAFSVIFNIGNYASIRFFSLFFFIVPVFLVKGEPMSFVENNLPFYLKSLIILISCSIIIDFLFLLVGMSNLQPMYDVEKYSYLNRPFGLFGQPSVNSCILCFCYLFYLALQGSLGNKDKNRWLLLLFVVVGVVMQGSGSGYISLFLLLFSILIRNKNGRIRWGGILLIVLVFIPIVYHIITSNVVGKISLDYISFLIAFFYDDLIIPYLKMANSYDKILFGIPDFPLSIDFGPLYILGTVGLFFLLFIVSFTLYLLFKTNNFNMKMGIIILLVGNLHYPVMFYLVMHFLWFFILYYIIVIDKRCKKKCLSKFNYHVS